MESPPARASAAISGPTLPDLEAQRIGSGARGLVEQQQLGARGERSDQLHLLAIALRQRSDLLARVELKALHEHVAIGDVGGAVQAREKLERLRTCQRRPQER